MQPPAENAPENFPENFSDTTIAIVGAGRLGTVLARALRAVGFDVRGPFGRGDDIDDAHVAILAVPDVAIAEVATRTSSTKRAHLSGATGLDAVDLSVHPLQTFTGREGQEAFRGVGAAIDGRTADDLALAERLARALGMTPFAVTDRASYHAAASFASNFVLTVLDAAEQIARSAGIEHPRDLLAPLVRQTVDNWQREGAPAVLTGPIVRGDDTTIARQRAATPDKDLFDALVTATRALKERA